MFQGYEKSFQRSAAESYWFEKPTGQGAGRYWEDWEFWELWEFWECWETSTRNSFP